ncbi:hypothetical protein PF007_g28249 [Phytophthora fragariae]|uniref:Uncharacterized protein n=1 Tax=Phytophthora fragariae TaxID=53985 RepID=A0A6A3Q1B6_9STRA|nr:hypothetical protein PF007_g28249 [Phytophthora fragariae]
MDALGMCVAWFNACKILPNGRVLGGMHLTDAAFDELSFVTKYAAPSTSEYVKREWASTNVA